MNTLPISFVMDRGIDGTKSYDAYMVMLIVLNFSQLVYNYSNYY